MNLEQAKKLIETKITQSYNLRGLRPQKDYADPETGEIRPAEPGAGFVDISESVANLATKITDILRGSGEYIEPILNGKKYQVRAINQPRTIVAKYESSNTFVEDGVKKVKLPATAYVGLAKASIDDLPTVEDVEVQLEDVTVQEDTVSQL